MVDDLPLAFREAVLAQRLLGHGVEAAAQALDPVDDSLDLEVDAGEVVLGEEPIDVILLFALVGHRRILDQKCLDVKSLYL